MNKDPTFSVQLSGRVMELRGPLARLTFRPSFGTNSAKDLSFCPRRKDLLHTSALKSKSAAEPCGRLSQRSMCSPMSAVPDVSTSGRPTVRFEYECPFCKIYAYRYGNRRRDCNHVRERTLKNDIR